MKRDKRGIVSVGPLTPTTCMPYGRPDCQYDMIIFMIIQGFSSYSYFFFLDRVCGSQMVIRWRDLTILLGVTGDNLVGRQGPNLNFLFEQTEACVNKNVFLKKRGLYVDVCIVHT